MTDEIYGIKFKRVSLYIVRYRASIRIHIFFFSTLSASRCFQEEPYSMIEAPFFLFCNYFSNKEQNASSGCIFYISILITECMALDAVILVFL